jgi:hypothetical protein
MTAEIRTTSSNKSRAKITDSRWTWLYRVGGTAALITGLGLLTAMISLIVLGLQPDATNDWFSRFQNNWLIVIFKLHAGFRGVQSDLLHGLNFLDMAILALVGMTCLSLYAALWRTSRIWSIIAMVHPFLGMVIFVATKTAGRCTVMGAGLVISCVMLQSRGRVFGKITACVGILASVLLLAGDFSVGIPHSNIVATLFGIGYVLLIIWFFLIGRRLFQLGQTIQRGAK